MTVRRAHPLQPGEQWVPGSRVARRARGTARDRGVLEAVRRGTKRRALPHARCPERGQAGRGSEWAIAAEALMNNPGQGSLTGLQIVYYHAVCNRPQSASHAPPGCAADE